MSCEHVDSAEATAKCEGIPNQPPGYRRRLAWLPDAVTRCQSPLRSFESPLGSSGNGGSGTPCNLVRSTVLDRSHSGQPRMQHRMNVLSSSCATRRFVSSARKPCKYAGGLWVGGAGGDPKLRHALHGDLQRQLYGILQRWSGVWLLYEGPKHRERRLWEAQSSPVRGFPGYRFSESCSPFGCEHSGRCSL